MSKYSKIAGLGSFIPEKILTNADFEKMVDTSDEWIITRTGIKERHIVDENTFTSDIAAKAAEMAIKNANLSPLDIDLIILTTVTPDMISPSCSCLVQKKIGASNAAAFDLNAACSGFLYGLTVADNMIKTDLYTNILVVGAETLSKVTDYRDRNTCILFGDGAGAVVLTKSDVPGIHSTLLGADGIGGNVLTIPGLNFTDEDKERRPFENPRSTIWMDGSEVFKFAVRIMADSINKVLEKAGKTLDDVDLIIPHQANVRIIDGAIKRLKCSPDKVIVNLDKYGNTSSASIPISLCEAVKDGRLKKGDTAVAVGFGAGLTWSSAVITV